MREDDSVICIKGVGEKTQKLFEKLGIGTVGDLLSDYPRDYEVYTDIQPIASVREGGTVIVKGSLFSRPRLVRTKSLTIVSCVLSDGTGKLPVRWFHMPFLMKNLQLGRYYILRGRVENKDSVLQMTQPKILTEKEYANLRGKLWPVYRLTEGLTNNAVRKAVQFALENAEFGEDNLPAKLRKEYDLQTHGKAVFDIHFPEDTKSYQRARQRLVFEEFFFFSLALKQLKEEKDSCSFAQVLLPGKKTEALLKSLPYSLTDAQERVRQEILADLGSGRAMNRLLQGDVGSGKTVVALLAMLCAAENGKQAAIMVPTEVLAKQHNAEFKRLLDPLGVRTSLLTGSLPPAKKREIKKQIAAHETDIIVGTHALIQENVEYDSLALVVTDEQHRFGVRQRETLAKKGENPHLLVMSATPIPRTLAITFYADLDVSVIDSRPKNRLPIKNCVVDTSYRPQAYRFMQGQVSQGHQCIIICPMVEESEQMEAENVTDYTERLRDIFPPAVRIECLHGRMRPEKKNEQMEQFAAGKTDILVSTTVIEVGIDVPNATVMMIENAERFGLAQLHQLRGRVGRGSAQSYCIFMTGNPTKENRERLAVLEESNDGFVIAKKDLEMRGPGEFFGTVQSGDFYFQLADVFLDAKQLCQAGEAAKNLSRDDVRLLCQKNAAFREKMIAITGKAWL